MTTGWATATLIGATITNGLMAGLFAAYSYAVMPGLARAGDRTFVEAMQQTNAAILNGWFGICFGGALVFALAAATACGQSAPPPLDTGTSTTTVSSTAAPEPTVESVTPIGDFSPVARLIDDAIAARRLPGAVVQVGHAGKIVFRQAFGVRKLAGEPGRGRGHPAAAGS